MRVDVNCVLALRPSPRGCFRRAANHRVADGHLDTWPPRMSALNSLYGIVWPGRREEPCLHDGEQQQRAEHPPDGKRRPAAERPALAGLAITRVDARSAFRQVSLGDRLGAGRAEARPGGPGTVPGSVDSVLSANPYHLART